MAQVIDQPLAPPLSEPSEPIIETPVVDRDEYKRARRAFAFWSVVTGLIVGLAGNGMFYNQYVGLSMLFFAIIAIAALLIMSYAAPHRAERQPLNLRNLWLIIPILFFTGMFAVRMNENLLFLDISAAAGLFLLLLHNMTSQKAVDTQPLGDYIGGAWIASIRSLTDTGFEARDAWMHVREAGLFRQRQGMTAILRGLMFTIPVILVFAALLGSADQVFGKYLGDFFQGLFPGDLGELMMRGTLTFSLAWVAIGGLSYALWRRNFSLTTIDTSGEVQEESPTKRKNTFIQFTMIEGGMMLGSVNLLFAAFVVIQFRYLFGGQANITAEGFTFSEYARRGFYELLTVTLLTLGLALFMDWVTVRRDNREQTLFRGLSVVLTALVGVMIFSAVRRVGLYVEAYGLTDDRLYAYVFIIWLGGLFLAFLAQLFKIRKNAFAFGVLLAAIGYTASMNLINVDLTIAQTNIARYHAGSDLDICYLDTLSIDALPAVLTLRDDVIESDPELFTQLDVWLNNKLSYMGYQQSEQTLFEFNTVRNQALTTWDTVGQEVQAQISGLESYPYCYTYGYDYRD